MGHIWRGPRRAISISTSVERPAVERPAPRPGGDSRKPPEGVDIGRYFPATCFDSREGLNVGMIGTDSVTLPVSS